MPLAISPYHKPGFYDQALANGRHRDIVGGRWDDTGRAEMRVLQNAGLRPEHHLLDIGAGCLRLGCKAVPYLAPGHYWATDKSGALMLKGREVELADPALLPEDHLIEDDQFAFPGVPATITHAIAFAVFTHLPLDYLGLGLGQIQRSFPALQCLLFTVFLAPDANAHPLPHRQPDGAVTHPCRAPYHHLETQVLALCNREGFRASPKSDLLPRGQVLFTATRA